MANMTFEEWKEKYKPYSDEGGEPMMYETFGDDLAFVKKQNPLCIWTEANGDEGEDYICSGYHFVNRIGYYITEIPFGKDEYIEVEEEEGFYTDVGTGKEYKTLKELRDASEEEKPD